MAPATDNKAVSEAFTVTSGVKQGCVLALIPFSFMFSVMLMEAYRDERPEIRVGYGTVGQLPNQRRMHFQLRPQRRSMHPFAAACKNLAVIIHIGKTVAMHQPPPYAAYNAPQINVNGAQMQASDNFTCLGITLSCSDKIEDKVAHWVSKASQAFGRL
nr:unnamed protein product [Spirometra erinaceieuropaei]